MEDQEKTEIYGNSLARHEVSLLVNHRTPARVVVLSGPSHVGKYLYLSRLLSDAVSETDLSVAETTVDGIREAREFLQSGPLFSPFKAVLVDNADFLTEPAQDALLKLLEEPPAHCRVFLVLEDEGCLLPALQNRLENIIRWTPLSESEMHEYASTVHRLDDNAIMMSRGRPGFYGLFLNDQRYHSFCKLCVQIMLGQVDPVQIPVPELISSLKSGRSVERDAICHTISVAVSELRSNSGVVSMMRNFLRLASDLFKNPSLNAEIHWYRACLNRHH